MAVSSSCCGGGEVRSEERLEPPSRPLLLVGKCSTLFAKSRGLVEHRGLFDPKAGGDKCTRFSL